MDIDFDSEIRAHLNEVLKLKKPSGVFTASAQGVHSAREYEPTH